MKRFKRAFFNESQDIKIRVYNLLLFTGIAGGLCAAGLGMLIKDGAATPAINLTVSVLAVLLLFISDKTKKYRLCSWILVITVFMIAFPILYFLCGGHMSGAAFIFIFAIVFTSAILEKREKCAALAVEAVLYISCIVVGFYKPGLSSILKSDFAYVYSTIMNLMISCVLLVIFVQMRARMYHSRQEEIQELNRELVARNETLAKYDVMKSDFLASVAHEINTPLAIISASSSDTLDLLKESPLKTGDIIENQRMIEKRVKMIDGILLDLMDTVAIENGRFSLSREPVFLSGLIKNVCGVQYKKLDINGNNLTYDLQDGLPRIWLDPSRIEQVLTNLLSNALRHTKKGNIEIKLTQSGGYQTVCVRDDGEGMEPEAAKVVLKQYVSEKADYWRHGIGLYICRRIILAHGGDIWVESVLGRGTAITFKLAEANV